MRVGINKNALPLRRVEKILIENGKKITLIKEQQKGPKGFGPMLLES